MGPAAREGGAHVLHVIRTEKWNNREGAPTGNGGGQCRRKRETNDTKVA